jgi:hypothetical protein
MPLEVNELGIFMKVVEKEDDKRQEGKGTDCEGCADFSRDEVVEDCVARILEILERKNSR